MRLAIFFLASILSMLPARGACRGSDTGNARPRIIYVYDALCGWCFGFSPVMARFAGEYAEKVDLEVVSGGLRTGNQAGPISAVAPYIKRAYKDVESATGVRFGDAFVNGTLEKGTAVMNSFYPAVAMAIFRERFPQKSLAFAGLLHHMIYVDGHSTEELDAYRVYAARLGFPEHEFSAKMRDGKYAAAAEADFIRAAKLGATGFPTLLLQRGDKVEKLFSGFVRWEELKRVVDARL